MPFRSSSAIVMASGHTLLRCLALPAVGFLLAASLDAQQPQPAPSSASAPTAPAAQTGVVLRGLVSDPDDAVIPGAAITLTSTSGKAITGASGSDGSYVLRNVAPGTYSLTITMPGFATFVRLGVKVAATGATTLNARMAVQDTQTIVNVTTKANTVSVDQDSNASATVLTGKDLDALSDDPDELSSELSALAGPAAGPNGGQIYIDGFTGGTLPPKSSIREIRINQNPFSAQYDRAGFGRVEVFTKPGTDKFHGNANVQGQDKSFNTGSPYLQNTIQSPYHTLLGQGSITGPLTKTASFTFAGSYRQIQDNAVVNPPSIYATSSTAQSVCYPGTAGCTIFSLNPVVDPSTGKTIAPGGNPYISAQFIPQTRWEISPRIDLALGEKNTLTTRFQYEHNVNQNGGIGGNDIFSTGSNSTNTEAEIQATDTQIISAKIINETRFEWNHETSASTPLSGAPRIVVSGSFTGGGSGSQASSDVQTHLEFQNYTSIALKKNFIRLGGRLRTTNETNTTTAGSNGAFTYASMADYINGVVNQYSITKINTPTISARSTDLGLYAETDWKVRPNLTWSYGLRYETQNYIHDHTDFAPRTSIAWGVTKKTVIRAGAGLFYDRFGLSNEFSVYRNNGTNQQKSIIQAQTGMPVNTACNPGNPNLLTACPASSTGHFTTNSISSNLRAPYSLQINAGVDEQLSRGATISVNYQHIRGVHQFNSNVANFSSLSAITPIQYQYQSEGIFNQNQVVTNVNYRFGRISLFGFYVLNYAKSDTNGANSFGTNPYNLAQDYGRAGFDTRHRVFMGGNVTLPHLVSLSPFMIASSGSPYNITTGTDNNGDTIFNDRPVLVPVGTQPIAASGTTVAGLVKTIDGCGTFATPGTPGNVGITPVNSCTGPGNFTMNLRLAKTIGFGRSNGVSPTPQGGGPGGGGDRRGGGQRGGPMGFGGGGGTSSGKRYNLSLGLQIQNLFNVVDRGTPIGTLTSSSFGTSTALAGGAFTTNSAVRRIYLQTSFNF